ncbi:MAG: type II toxin-antitoxin system PemK/MazF family toxin [Rhodospirillaceae bacterium]|nr:type II toxin-antitoxin system PemK/MazF family toxin [Rhodospirillaceae bacterium]
MPPGARGGRGYVPARGDFLWLEFDPATGHEQRGLRPALALTPLEYCERTGLVLACPITSQRKGYPFEVAIPEGMKISGVVLADLVKSFDYRARRARLAGRAPPELVGEVLARLHALL